jgi:hypothetical protein
LTTFDGGSQLSQQISWNKFHIRCAYFTPNCTWSLNYSVLVKCKKGVSKNKCILCLNGGVYDILISCRASKKITKLNSFPANLPVIFLIGNLLN